jgi:hypothetical protein
VAPSLIASATEAPTAVDTASPTNAVVASWVVFVPDVAVGARGVPVNVGEAIGAFKSMAAVFTSSADLALITSSEIKVAFASSADLALVTSSEIKVAFASSADLALVTSSEIEVVFKPSADLALITSSEIEVAFASSADLALVTSSEIK